MNVCKDFTTELETTYMVNKRGFIPMMYSLVIAVINLTNI